MSSIHSAVYAPPITHVSTNEGTSAGAAAPRSSDSENAPAAEQGGTTESSDFLRSYAGDNAPEFHEPEASTSTRSPKTAAEEPSQKTPESDFKNWLDSNPKLQKRYDKLDDAGKEKVKQTHQELSEGLDSVGGEAKKLPNDSRKEVEGHLENAKSALQEGNLGLAKEHFGYAKGSLEQTQRQAGQSSTEVRKWPEKSDAVYPHKGKHKPGLNTTNASESLIKKKIEQESSKGGAAKYNTSVASEVHKLEGSAYENGLSLSHDNGFSTIHKFGETIGASEGEMTPYIRLDGTDHGHPITQDQFNSYMQKEVDHLKQNGSSTTEIGDYLNKIGENPKNFGITS
ncbi:hypothetical protein [Edaphobacter modestus]|uniref:Uncharacterized protein n=1 Tax=Edaphobacter modestus TaxID=388466 RepID=A0A4Q7YYI1_9BACT|nr:hypothetical protein [Edaphobacter modestus]RZU42225.1 hypothetical protein BDD14_3778 [Edaphobacter modestus]